MDRTERLLDVVALLLDASAPVSWAALREAFPDEYGGSDEAAVRKFERDKVDLLELGIPLTWRGADDEGDGGYVIDKATYYLPDSQLSAAELAQLYAAGSAALASGAFPGAQDLAYALRKISFFADGPPPVPKVRLELGEVRGARELPAHLEQLWGAINAKKAVQLEYFSPRSQSVTHRKVDPWGLALRRGLWSLVGFCHLRQAPRVFHVHRIRSLTVNTAKPRSADFEVPADFVLDDWVAAWPWQHRFHEPVEVTVTLSGDLAPLAASLFGLERPPPVERGVATVPVTATDLDGLVTTVLSLGPQARIVGPAAAVDRVRAVAERIAAAHGAPSP